jgi:hypothetical protein
MRSRATSTLSGASCVRCKHRCRSTGCRLRCGRPEAWVEWRKLIIAIRAVNLRRAPRGAYFLRRSTGESGGEARFRELGRRWAPPFPERHSLSGRRRRVTERRFSVDFGGAALRLGLWRRQPACGWKRAVCARLDARRAWVDSEPERFQASRCPLPIKSPRPAIYYQMASFEDTAVRGNSENEPFSNRQLSLW